MRPQSWSSSLRQPYKRVCVARLRWTGQSTRRALPVKRESSAYVNLRTMTTMNPEDQSPVPSPCISLCKMSDETGLCEGCLRTIDEIIAWSQADDDFKRGVWAEIRRREAQIGFPD